VKIALIQPRVSYFTGGGEKLPLIHAKYLALAGIDVTIYTTKQEKQSFLYEGLLGLKLDHLQVKEFEVPEKFKYLYEQKAGEDRNRWDTECLFFNSLVFDELRNDRPDLVLSYYILDGVIRPAELKGALYLLGYPSDQLSLRRSLLRFFDATISVSSGVKNNWGDQLKEVNKNFVLNSGVEKSVSGKKIVSEFKNNIVFAGRLVERKGLITLLESFKKLGNEDSSHLWIIGDGPQKEQIEKSIDQYNLKDKVTLTGLVENASDYFEMANICVFPSYEGEGLMGVVLEAMLCGRAVITTINNGNEDVITNGKNGILIPSRDSETLTNELKKLLTNDDLRISLGEEARRYAEMNLNWEEFTNKFINILKQI